jgi:CheY-like chemotaxis protein
MTIMSVATMVATAEPAPRRALLVEDDADVRQILTAYLELEGLGVIAAGDGIEGLERAAREQPDLIVTDVAMPRMDGLTMVRRLREQAARVPVLVISGNAEPANAAAAGGTAFLPKPLALSVFRSTVQRLLAGVAA